MWRLCLKQRLGKREKQKADETFTPSLTLPPRGGGMDGWAVFYLLCSVFFLLLSCSPKRVEMPTFEGVDVRDELSKKERIQSVTSTFHIEFERDGSIIRGDAALRLTADSLDLQVYSFGFLVAEITSNHDFTTSNPTIEGSRLLMLIEGIRDSFFWWSIKDPSIREDRDTYRISNSWRRLFVNKKTMMPEKQVIELEDGGQMNIFYDEPAFFDGAWFPSKMRIELSRHSVNLVVKTLSFDSP